MDSEVRKCVDCVHWTESGPDDLRCPNGFGSCDSQKFIPGYGASRDEKPGDTMNQVIIEDDEGWGFFTGPDFGCIHFSARALTNSR